MVIMAWHLYANGVYIGRYCGSAMDLARSVRIVRYYIGWAVDVEPRDLKRKGR